MVTMTPDEYVPTIVQVGVAAIGAAAVAITLALVVRWWLR